MGFARRRRPIASLSASLVLVVGGCGVGTLEALDAGVDRAGDRDALPAPGDAPSNGVGGDEGAADAGAPATGDTASPAAPGTDFGTPGGAGGQVLRVTHLGSNGPGSLRTAMEGSGPRIVVFEVGGVIDLGQDGIRVDSPYLTVAGQTAPSPGITLIRAGISIRSHDVIIQHLRVRPGDAGEPRGSGWEPDGIATYGADAHDIVVDHCSITWAVDENLSASGPRTEGTEATSRNITFQHNIIAEGLDDSTHAKGPHSKGSLIHDNCTGITVVGNLYAHNAQRNPYFKAFTTGMIVNNVIYNPRERAIQLGYSASEWDGTGITPQNARVSVVGNVLLHGVDTDADLALVGSRGDAYMDDNLAFYRDGAEAELARGDVTLLTAPPFWRDDITVLPASQAIDAVIAHAGARPAERDPVDARIIEDLRARTGRIIDSQDDVGGYPAPQMTTRALEVPSQNIEAWLSEMAAAIE